MADRFNLGSFVEATAFAALDEVFATFHSEDGYARPSRYEAYFFPPISKSQTNVAAQMMGEQMMNGTARKTALRCQTFEFPGRNLDTTEDTNIYGPVRNIVSGYSYAETTAVFQCSSDMKEKMFFETWQRLAYNPQTWAMQYYNDYSGSIKIFQLDETDRQRYGIELVECFPKTIAAQALDYSTVNAIQTVSVTFSYRYWKDLKDEAELPKPLGERMTDAVLNTVESKITSAIPKVLQKL
jgi:hypothetical protein